MQTKPTHPPFPPSHITFTRTAFFAVGVTVATANIDAIAVTDYELGYCTSLSPTGTPPSPPGYWCSSFNRGVVEKACWLATQNCCSLDMNKTVAPYPGTGQCVHTDPCADSGGKLCGSAPPLGLCSASGLKGAMRWHVAWWTPLCLHKRCRHERVVAFRCNDIPEEHE